MIALWLLPMPAWASAARSCGSDSPPITMPPILRKSRRARPSQVRRCAIARAENREHGGTPSRRDLVEGSGGPCRLRESYQSQLIGSSFISPGVLSQPSALRGSWDTAASAAAPQTAAGD